MSVSKMIKRILLIPLFFILVVVIGFAYCELNKAYWDEKVGEMCEKDGGVVIYEKVEVFLSNYPNLTIATSGSIIFPDEGKAGPADPFFIRSKKTTLREKSPVLYKYELSVIRRSDNKELGKRVSYSRVGGDFPTAISHPSSFSCQSYEKDLREFSSIVSVKGE